MPAREPRSVKWFEDEEKIVQRGADLMGVSFSAFARISSKVAARHVIDSSRDDTSDDHIASEVREEAYREARDETRRRKEASDEARRRTK